MADRLHMPFYHGFGDRSDMTDLGRRLHMEAHNALDMTKLCIMLGRAVEAGRLHPRRAELYHDQIAATLAQLASDLALHDPGWQAERDGQTDPVGRLRHEWTEFARCLPENEADYASIGRKAVETAKRVLAAIPPTRESK